MALSPRSSPVSSRRAATG